MLRNTIETTWPNIIYFLLSATTVLHNYLRSKEIIEPGDQRRYCPPGYADTDDEENGNWRNIGSANALNRLSVNNNNNYTKEAKKIRDNLTYYFNNSGIVEWQYERAGVNKS